MATVNPRINVTLSKADLGVISMLAKDQNKSISAIARDLIEEALDLQDAARWIKISEERKNEPTVSHEEVMKMFGVDD